MNCEDVPMSEWDKLTGAEQEALMPAFLAVPWEFSKIPVEITPLTDDEAPIA